MSGGANSIKEGRPVVTGTQASVPGSNPREVSSSFQRVLTQNSSKAPGDPKVYLAGLGRVTQTGNLSFNQRVEAFRAITEQIITHPSHPYSRIERELREEMIDSVAGTLADSPVSLPRAVRRVV